MNRFFKVDDTVTDNATGLMWPQNASLYEFPMTWKEALAFVHNLNKSCLSGYYDWKLPNRRELFSLISHDTIHPCLPEGHPFENVFSGYYWTSTTCDRLSDQAWYIHFGGAKVYKGMKYASYMVWPVRETDGHNPAFFQTGQKTCYDEKGTLLPCEHTGQDGEFQSGIEWDISRFVKHDVTVSDILTNLMWFENAGYFSMPMDWKTAFATVKKINNKKLFGYSDWRLPHIIELEKLTDMSMHSPALPKTHPFINIQQYYWSATESRYNQNYSWVMYMQDGAVGVGHKRLAEFFIWPVRTI